MHGKLELLKNELLRLTAIPEGEWTFFTSLVAPRTLRKGEFFVRQGDDCPDIGFVLQGVCRYFYLTSAGEEVIKAFACEGMPVSPYSAQLQGQPANLSIEALAECELLTMKYADQVRLYPRHPCWQEIGRKNAERLYIAKERREWQLLLLDAQARLAAFESEFPGLATRIPQYQIAYYLGIKPVTLSRIMSRLRAK